MTSRAIWSVVLAVAVGAFTEPLLASDGGTAATAEQLVADALRAEAAGDAGRRSELLANAIQIDPAFQPARWHSGQVQAGDQWQPIEQAQQAAAADPRRSEYFQLRQASSDSLDGQLALARWCRKNGFGDEAQFHWRTVLSHQPNNDEALRALGVRWYAGRLMTRAEVEAAKEEQRESRRAAKRFAPQVGRWERLLAAGDIRSRDEALDEIRTLDDVAAIPAVEDLTLDERLSTHERFDRCLQVSLAFIEALRGLRGQAATESLVRHAVVSPIKSVRAAAIEALKERPMHDYVPMLLVALSMPIESSFRVVNDGDGSVHYWHSLYREGPDANWSVESRRSAMQHDLAGAKDLVVDDRVRGEVRAFRQPALPNPRVAAEMATVAAQSERRFGAAALTAEQQIDAINAAIEDSNAQVVPVLAATTDQDFGENPRAWWDWWEQHNEYYSEDEEPVYERTYADSSHRYYRPPTSAIRVITPLPPPGRYRSCFAKGTLVWTKIGQRAIETLEIGDLVLAQDADTGELAYKPIVGRTVRPPSETVNLSLGDEKLRTTLGHPFWVAGVGWRMAKELGDGAILHGVHGPVRIDAVEPTDEVEAYNLVVADFNTYFVGEAGVLVHDNTPREPTTAVVPGMDAN